MVNLEFHSFLNDNITIIDIFELKNYERNMGK